MHLYVQVGLHERTHPFGVLWLLLTLSQMT